jgi:hypothetical protein
MHTSRVLFGRRYMRDVSTLKPEFAQNSVLNYQTCEICGHIGSLNVP